MGEKQLIGHGYIRDVYLVDLKGGRKVVVKFVREDYDKRTSDSRIEKIHRWEAAALDAVSGGTAMTFDARGRPGRSVVAVKKYSRALVEPKLHNFS